MTSNWEHFKHLDNDEEFEIENKILYNLDVNIKLAF